MADASSAFFDTNILLYLLGADHRKADIAEAVIGAGGCISVQVLNEFTAVSRRKLGLSWNEIDEILRGVRVSCSVVPLTEQVHDRARVLAAHYRFSFYDAVIVASALLAECALLYTEDLRHGQVINRALTVCDPFK